MKRFFFIAIPTFILATIVFLSIQIFLMQFFAKGALQITSVPESKVYLNGKLIGQTPLCKCPEKQDMLPVGDYMVKLEPLDKKFSVYQEKIAVVKSVLTVLDRKFGTAGTAEGSTISLSPLPQKDAAQMLVVTFPEKAAVFVDEKQVGESPVSLKEIMTTEHKVKIRKQGYKEKILPVRTPKGYKLQVVVDLGIVPGETEQTAEHPIPSLTPSAPPAQKVVILETPTGFLRVRADASLDSSEVGRVSPGQTYDLLTESEGWYQISLRDGTKGWVNAQYAEKQE